MYLSFSLLVLTALGVGIHLLPSHWAGFSDVWKTQSGAGAVWWGVASSFWIPLTLFFVRFLKRRFILYLVLFYGVFLSGVSITVLVGARSGGVPPVGEGLVLVAVFLLFGSAVALAASMKLTDKSSA